MREIRTNSRDSKVECDRGSPRFCHHHRDYKYSCPAYRRSDNSPMGGNWHRRNKAGGDGSKDTMRSFHDESMDRHLAAHPR
ncbi:hypothetical protein DACRYDRAFT_91956 [Dacryopinax primogenitus]|uniref:Uncharacterized protein n=1 Tax=Dacryopinax primogenitus (strain DJM 731) TaxID=1858805 RepID=M5FPG0_DACPD|nr:uncharacterized protein DACRYDRAFT_91956 [Dacryopinax primogenitus]EJT97048.1 hypothetical protein DACRYDRAFT_91956 [Dacryopinax primogenitus]